MKAELVVTDRSWPLRNKFLDALRRKLAAMPNRIAFYPGQCCCRVCMHGTTAKCVRSAA